MDALNYNSKDMAKSIFHNVLLESWLAGFANIRTVKHAIIGRTTDEELRFDAFATACIPCMGKRSLNRGLRSISRGMFCSVSRLADNIRWSRSTDREREPFLE